MPFDQSKPADSEKIRNIGSVIRPNWKAIEEGSNDDSQANKLKLWSVNYFSRDDIPSAPGSDADELTDGIVMYSKTDADTTFPELFVRHEDATVTQVTKGPATINASSGETSIYGGLLLKYGVTGVFTSGNTFSFTDVSLTDFPNNIFTVILTSEGVATSYQISNLTTSGFDITYGTSGASFHFIAIGN